MAVFKCKMCGGALEIKDESVITCEYCGTQQTLPKLNDEKRSQMYDRANHFRRNNEFDKAMGIYEQILNEDQTDAEAYWSIVLCRYGIEYVEDPATHKRIPTVNRAQFTAVFDDANYKSALQYADVIQRGIYESEAKAINEIQKGILAISQKEEPFDVFICYKETDSNGRRTPDSVLANELYHQLTAEGFKVFYAAITLEDKLGSAYEPYIFAALHSAKVMVVLGTKPEYFNAVWVKNEWSRFLALVKNDSKKMLIPAYKDMDPYDLPEEFSHLQAQDMSKLGFMQDLIRGIKKIIGADAARDSVNALGANQSGVEAIIDRAFLSIEDGEKEKADELLEQALNLAPRNPMIYVGKLMIELGVKKQDELATLPEPFETSPHYEKAIRFASIELKNTLEGYASIVRDNFARSTYEIAVTKMDDGQTEEDFLAAKAMFDSIDYYSDAKKLSADCADKAKEALYQTAVSLMALNGSDKINDLQKAFDAFASLENYKDSKDKMEECEKELAVARELSENNKQRNKRIAIISISGVVAIIVFIILLIKVIIPNNKYNKAKELLQAGAYDSAIAAFEEMNGYKDSEYMIREGKYYKALSYLREERFDEANAMLEELRPYYDVDSAILDAYYSVAKRYFDEQEYSDAYKYYEKAESYSDAVEMAKECLYRQAKICLVRSDQAGANIYLEKIRDYKDSASLIHYHNYQLIDSQDATCDAGGFKSWKCDCGYEYVETVYSTGHAYSAATCTAPQTCSRCGVTDGSPLGHSSTGTTCDRCGAVTFETLTYSGTGTKMIKGVNLPNGAYIITCSFVNHSSGVSNAAIWFRYSSGSDLVLNGSGDSGSESSFFNGAVSDGYFQVETKLSDCTWKIVIEAQ